MAENEKGKSGKVSIGKRAKISKAQRNMFISIALASIVLGVTLVGVVYLAKVIKFNTAVIAEKSKANEGIKTVQENLVNISNDVESMSTNEYLESVGRQRSKICKTEDIESFEYSLSRISIARTCTALRVIPDSMPSVFNQEAAVSSLNQLLLWSNGGSGVGIESLGLDRTASIPARFPVSTVTGDDSSEYDPSLLTVNPIGITVSLTDGTSKVMGALDMIERSIRPFDISSFALAWTEDADANSGIELTATYVGYYSNKKTITINEKTLCASSDSKKCGLLHGVEVGK